MGPPGSPGPSDKPADLDGASGRACHVCAADWQKARASRDVDLMWQVIARAAHHLHMDLAGKTCPKGRQRARAKAVQDEEYGPGVHRDGLDNHDEAAHEDLAELGKSQELSPCALAEFEHENLNFGENLKYGLFRQLTVYVDKFVLVGDESTAVQFHPLELTEMTCAFYGARITGNPYHPDLSHVIVSQNDLERLDQLKKIRYV